MPFEKQLYRDEAINQCLYSVFFSSSFLFRLEKERSKAHAEAQTQVKDEVSRILAMEKAGAEDSIKKAILRERVSAEDERIRAQIYVST